MKLIFEENNLKRVEKSIKKFEKIYNDKWKSSPVILSDTENAKSIYNQSPFFIKEYEKSYGAGMRNIPYEGKNNFLIVLNFDNINKHQLDDDEIAGIITHELGHFLNKFEKLREPTDMDIVRGTTTREEIETIKKTNRENNEIYADHFAKMMGTEDGLISSINKFQRSDLRTNDEIFQLRLQKLKSLEVFLGVVDEI